MHLNAKHPQQACHCSHLPALPLIPPLLLLPAGLLHRRLCGPLLPLQGTQGALQAGLMLLQLTPLHKGGREGGTWFSSASIRRGI